MGLWKLNGCPRCGGDLRIEKDLFFNWYEQCIQCGFIRYLKEIAKVGKKSEITNGT